MQLFRPTAQLKISLTSDCNNDCPMCLNDTRRTGNGQRARLSHEVVQQLIEQAAHLGMVGTYWTGGEPLVEYEELLRCVQHSTRLGLTSTLVTNAGLMGAAGAYRQLNRRLLERGGLYNVSAAQAARQLRRAGLTRVYVSADSNHTTRRDEDCRSRSPVPLQAVMRSLTALLSEDFGARHRLQAIGHCLRVTATASGQWTGPTESILTELRRKLGGRRIADEKFPGRELWETRKGSILVKRLGVSNVGAARDLGAKMLEDRSGEALFALRCPHFLPTSRAYDGGLHHRDLFVNHDGTVYSCGNGAHPLGDIWSESLPSIVRGANRPEGSGPYSINRTVFRTLLILAERTRVGPRAVGEALRLAASEDPGTVQKLRTQCGSCHALGHDPKLQEAFLRRFRRWHSS